MQMAPHANGFGLAQLAQPAVLKDRQSDQQHGAGGGYQQEQNTDSAMHPTLL
jgi:hypothetical protein